MADLMHLTVATADGIAVDTEVSYLQLPLKDGGCGILPHHSPIMGALTSGSTVIYRTADGDHEVTVDDGIITIAENRAMLLASAVHC